MTESLVYRAPEDDLVEVRLLTSGPDGSGGLKLKAWTEYSFNSHFETPTDGWHFTVGDDDIPPEIDDAIYVGQKVGLFVNGLLLGTGWIDSVERSATRGGGVSWRIEGKDVLGPVVASHVDPRKQFKKDVTLEDLIQEVFQDFGFEAFTFDGAANQAAKVGKPPKPTKKGKSRRGKAKLDQLRPQQHEGAYAFAERIANHSGLHIWASADGEQIIVDEPDYDQEPLIDLVRTATSGNILEGTVKVSIDEQPSIIIADGTSGGTEFGHSKIRAYCVNPFLGVSAEGVNNAAVLALLAQYPDARQVVLTARTQNAYRGFQKPTNKWQGLPNRPLFLHSESATTIEELEAYVRREMALRLRKAVAVNYTVEGHGQFYQGGAFVPYDVNTIVRVKDTVGRINGPMWVISRTFERSRGSGSTTKLELIVPGSLQFSSTQ